MKIVILGKGLMLANLILGANDAQADIAGVFRYETTCGDSIELFFKDIFNPDYDLTLIKELRLKQLKFKSANCEEFRKFLIKENIDLILVGTWREKIEKETFIIPTIGTVNAHPSLLPKYRGPNPYMQTILNGEEYSGITLHLVDSNYDTGAILSQEKIKINKNDTSKELREKTAAKARQMVSKLICDLNNKIITPIPQIEKQSTYYSHINGDERMLDFKKQTSVEISRTIRALHPFLPTYITYKNKFYVVNPYEFEITDTKYPNKAGEVIEKDSKKSSLTMVCSDGVPIRFYKLKKYNLKYRILKFFTK